MRKLALVFVAMGALAFAIAACGDDTQKKVDAKPKKLDGKVTQDDTGTTQQDTGTPGKEGTTPGKEAGVQKEAGGGTSGYGDACDPSAPTNTCAAGFDCVGIQGFTKGWCTKQCTEQLKVCPDMPLKTGPYTGAAAFCALSNADKTMFWCMFICQLKDTQGAVHTFPCPSPATKCGDEDPPGSGQKVCVPVS